MRVAWTWTLVWTLVLLAATTLMAGGATASQAGAPSPAATGGTAFGKRSWVRAGRERLLVQPQGGVKTTELRALFGRHNLARRRRIGPIQLHIVEGDAQSLAAAETALRADPRIRFVERDRRVPPALEVSDPYFAAEYHLARIGCPAAWQITTGAANAPIAILDSGVDAAHPDLAAKLIAGYNVFDGNTDTRDVSGHGTMVAGAAAAASNNGTGVAAVAWDNPIMPVRVTDTNGDAYVSTLAAGLVWAAEHGARVANLSFAVFGADSVRAAAQYFVAQGGVVFAAAGNDALTHSDAANPWVISVAATDAEDERAGFSSAGAYVDLAAPGVAITTTARGGGYTTVSGTSFASPVAAGVAGLLLGVNPRLTPTQIADLLAANARDLGPAGYDPEFGWGRVDAGNAVAAARQMVTKADTTPPVVSIDTPVKGTIVSGIVTVQVTAADDVAVRRVLLFDGSRLVGRTVTAPYTFAWDVSARADGPHFLTAVAYDTARNWMISDSVIVTVAK